MAFEGLTEKLNATFKKLRGKGRLTENDVREAMREVRMASFTSASLSFPLLRSRLKAADSLSDNPSNATLILLRPVIRGLYASAMRPVSSAMRCARSSISRE